MATYTGLDGIAGNAFVIVAGGIDLTAGEVVTQTLLVPDSTRTDRAFSVGTRVTEKDVTIGAGSDQNLDPLQLNLNIIGVNPGNSSTINGSYKLITHDTQAMANIRLKCSDWNVSVGVNLQDAYVYQGQVDFTGAVTVGGEAAVMGLTMNSGSSTVTGNLWGIVVVTTGSGAGKDAALFLSHRGGTLTQSIYIECNSAQTITNAIYVNQPGTITNFLKLNIEGFCAYNASFSGQSAAEPDASIRVIVGGNVLYLYAYPVIVS
ncbi:hypothetical protein LCGC14_0264020 [marine sediment metagenome]|uniref:Uncharacterized protein n=1 Tax=marine sediment metagenome TaxID=412755 RepID=A0A0F9X5M1_9ZZZZ